MSNVHLGKLKKLRDFLNLKYGIFIDDKKLESIYMRKIINLMKKFQYSDFSFFYKDIIFNKDQRLIQELINTITVNETYFFREKYQFDTLIQHIIPELDRKLPPEETINILSAPCSSGEEIYSIAIYLLEEGRYIKKRNFMLLGIDIDSNMIKKAKEGIYNLRSLQQVPKFIIQKYFQKEGKFYRVKEFLRKSVNFKVVNILDKHKMKRLGKFDVIFCRNMLIYFDERNRREALSTFYNILKKDGYLFLGHAESIPSEFSLFKQVKIGESYLYKKTEG
ncbi:CheR family methyltransferase [Persephonella sp.]